MNRLLTLLTLALLACSTLSAAPASSRPHVLLICVDDLKPTIGAYGDRLAKTPAIDRLAARSVLFENAYCNQAVCAASRNNLLVGSRSTTLGIYNLATNFRRAVLDAVTPKVPQTIDGRSLVPVLRDPNTAVKDHVMHCFPKSSAGRGEMLGRALRTARYRLVEWKKIGAPADTAEFELYDYETDPLETKNLAATQPDVVTRMRGLLAQHPEPRPVVAARP